MIKQIGLPVISFNYACIILSHREELEEFQSLWKEVRREINEMEQLIANRLGGLVMGNDNFNPLLALEIIHKVNNVSCHIM